MAWLLIVLLLFPSSGSAQSRKKTPAAQPAKKEAPAEGPAPTSWPIEALRVDGNQHYATDKILAVAGLRIGQVAGKPDFDAARDRLIATGFFDNVGYNFAPSSDGKGYAASFLVTEVEPVFPVRFEDLPAKPEELAKALAHADPLFSPKVPATQPVLQRYVVILEKYLEEQKHPDKVIGKVMAETPDQLALVFRSTRPVPSVAEVMFHGNSVVPSTALQNAIAGVAVGSVFNEGRFRQYLDSTIRPIYEARGRIRLEFPKIETGKASDVEGLVVKVEVKEGESYRLGNVTVEGSSRPAKELLKIGDFKTGDLANFELINAGVGKIAQEIRKNGYLQAKTQVDRKVDDEKHVVDLVVHIIPGAQYTFNKLTIQGLDVISEPVIRKLWGLPEGKPFNPEYPDYFIERVREQGLFDNLGDTKSIAKPDDRTHTVEVTLLFKGVPDRPERKRREQPGGPPL